MMTNEPLQHERTGLSAFWATREVDHLFGRFARATRFVLFSKWFLAVFALILLGALVIYPMTEKTSGARLSFVTEEAGTAPANPTGAEAPSMARPIYEGVDKNGHPYRITGGKATQITKDMVELSNVEAMLENNGVFISVTADKAQYRQEEKIVELVGNVNVLHGKGYNFVTPAATIDTATMDVTGSQEIAGEGPMGKLLATGFEIRNNGQDIRFGGTSRVNVTINQGRQ